MTLSASPRTVLATATAHLAASALRALAARGADWATEARRAGVPATLEPDFGWRVPVASVGRLFERGIARSGPDFPLDAAHRPPDGHTSPLALYCRTRASGRAALRALAANQDLVTDGWRITFDEPADALVWHGTFPAAVGWFELCDVALSARELVPGLAPLEVHTSLVPPPGLGRRVGRVVAPGPGLRLVFPKGALDRPLPGADPSVRALTERGSRRSAATCLPPASGRSSRPSGPARRATRPPQPSGSRPARSTGGSRRTAPRSDASSTSPARSAPPTSWGACRPPRRRSSSATRTRGRCGAPSRGGARADYGQRTWRSCRPEPAKHHWSGSFQA